MGFTGAGRVRVNPGHASVEGLRRTHLAQWDGPLDRPDWFLAVEWNPGDADASRYEYGWYEDDRLTGYVRYESERQPAGWIRLRVQEFITTTRQRAAWSAGFSWWPGIAEQGCDVRALGARGCVPAALAAPGAASRPRDRRIPLLDAAHRHDRHGDDRAGLARSPLPVVSSLRSPTLSQASSAWSSKWKPDRRGSLKEGTARSAAASVRCRRGTRARCARRTPWGLGSSRAKPVRWPRWMASSPAAFPGCPTSSERRAFGVVAEACPTIAALAAPALLYLRLARLRSQHLTDDSRLQTDVASVARSVCALQAQAFDAARHQVRVRSAGLTAAAVDRAFEHERTVVRTWLMRGTLHLCAADDVRWLLDVFGPAINQLGASSASESRPRRCDLPARRCGDSNGADRWSDGAAADSRATGQRRRAGGTGRADTRAPALSRRRPRGHLLRTAHGARRQLRAPGRLGAENKGSGRSMRRSPNWRDDTLPPTAPRARLTSPRGRAFARP